MKKRIFLIFAIILALGLLIPQRGVIPVQNATPKDWSANSFWFSPWGKSGVHKGIDIFAKQGTSVVSAVSGVVIFTGNIDMGGNVVAVLGPKWRIHYYAHLKQVDTHILTWESEGEAIGQVGATGNAAGKPPHLHYSVIRLIPNPLEITTETQGWKRMPYVNPAEIFS